MKLQKLFVFAAAAVACTLASTSHAVPVWTPPEIILTQTSDTALTATVDGSSLNVVSLGADSWFVYGFGAYLIGGSAQWVDPDAAGEVNTVISGLYETLDLGLFVNAGVTPGTVPQLGNDTKDITDYNYAGITALPVNVTFDDVITSNVPDAATTMPLLGVAAGTLFGLARRFRK